MLGKYVRVKVVRPIGAKHPRFPFTYRLNYGFAQGVTGISGEAQGVYIMGIDHPVREFDGRVIAIVRRNNHKGIVWVAAPKSKHFIVNEICDAIDFAEGHYGYTLECLYERSCGAVVYRMDAGQPLYLLIKNNRSAHWGFPKGHMEKGETQEETAKREVLEETGMHIRLLPDFSSKSEYTIQGKVEKSVTIFLAITEDKNTVIQQEEIEDFIWLRYDRALKMLNYENDKMILTKANRFLMETAMPKI